MPKKVNPFTRSSSLGGFTKILISKRKSLHSTTDCTMDVETEELTEKVAQTVPEKSVRLVLRQNGINTISPKFFEHTHLQYIRILEIADNKINNIPKEIVLLKELRDIDFSNNLIEVIPDHLIKLPNLKKIDLSGNCISEIPDFINDFPVLNKLLLNRNRIHFLPSQFTNNQTIKKISLLDNPTLVPPVLM